MEENNYVKHAKQEFIAAGWMNGKGVYDDNMQEAICKHVIKLLNVFAEECHSGASAPYAVNLFKELVELVALVPKLIVPYAINLFKELALFKTIVPLTGKENEWNDLFDLDNSQQNKRDSAVFKKDGQAYYINAVIFRRQTGSCFTGGGIEYSKGKLSSSQNIKKFPFTPKTFYVDVIETEWADKEGTKKQKDGGWWSNRVKDESQLDEIFKYYNKRE